MEILAARPDSFRAALVLGAAWVLGKAVEAIVRHLRTRVPLKRANDEHIERMTVLLRDLSSQQERTALAVERVAGGITDIAADVRVLLGRRKR